MPASAQEEDKPQRFESFRRVLAYPEYRHYLIASTPNLVSFWMHRIAVGWVMWELTGSATWLGFVAFAELFPTVLLTPLAGVYVDWLGPRRVAMVTQAIMAALMTIMAVMVGIEAATPLILVAFSAVQGITQAFFSPARLAMVPLIVPSKDVSNAIALNSILFNLARFIGPAMAGFIIATLGPAVAIGSYSVTASYYLVVFWLLVKLPDPDRQDQGRLDIIGDLLAGIRHARDHDGIANLLILSFASSITLRAVWELLPSFADGIWGAGAEGLGILASAPAIGSILAALYISREQDTRAQVNLVIWSIPATSIVLIAFAYAPSFWIAVALMGLSGATLLFNGVLSQSLMQTSSGRDMRGRVMGLYWMVFRGAPALGALLIGAFGDIFGISGPFAVACLCAAAVAIWISTRAKAMAKGLEHS